MRVSSQGEAGGRRPEHRRLLETAKGWTEEARRGLETGERLPPRQMTLYRYVCMATLTTSTAYRRRRWRASKELIPTFPPAASCFPPTLSVQVVCILAYDKTNPPPPRSR